MTQSASAAQLPSADRSFAIIVVARKLLTKDVLDGHERAVLDRRGAGESVTLSDVLVGAGAITPEQRVEIERARARHGRACEGCEHVTFMLPGDPATKPCEVCGGRLRAASTRPSERLAPPAPGRPGPHSRPATSREASTAPQPAVESPKLQTKPTGEASARTATKSAPQIPVPSPGAPAAPIGASPGAPAAPIGASPGAPAAPIGAQPLPVSSVAETPGLAPRQPAERASGRFAIAGTKSAAPSPTTVAPPPASAPATPALGEWRDRALAALRNLSPEARQRAFVGAGGALVVALLGFCVLSAIPRTRDFSSFMEKPARGRYRAVVHNVYRYSELGPILELGPRDGSRGNHGQFFSNQSSNNFALLPYRLWVAQGGSAVEAKLRQMNRDREANRQAAVRPEDAVEIAYRDGGGCRFPWMMRMHDELNSGRADLQWKPHPVTVSLALAKENEVYPTILALEDEEASK